MNDKIALGILIAVGFIGTTVAAPVLATTVESFLTIKELKYPQMVNSMRD